MLFRSGRFADFIAYFKEITDGKDMNELYGIDKSSSTKDKNVVLKKLNKLETMMCDFLGIVKIRLDDKVSGILEFIHEQVDSSVTREDVDLDNWIVDYCNRNHTYIDDQTENFRQMRNDLERFIKQTEAA